MRRNLYSHPLHILSSMRKLHLLRQHHTTITPRSVHVQQHQRSRSKTDGVLKPICHAQVLTGKTCRKPVRELP